MKDEKMDERLREKARAIKLLILDVDGVLTDGSITYTDSGEEVKRFDVKDGHGIKMLVRGGVEVAMITARSSEALKVRARDLGIERVVQGAKDKLPAFEKLLAEMGLTPSEVAYIGDDLIDLPVLRRAGLSAAVADAVDEVRKAVDIVTERGGGRGGVREFTDAILKGQGRYEEVTERYLK